MVEDTSNENSNSWSFVRKWIGGMVVAAVLAVSGGFINIRDTVRDHTLYLESLRVDQSEGKRFTRDNGDAVIEDISDINSDIDLVFQEIRKIKSDITNLSIVINSGKSREHEAIKELKKRLFIIETKYWEIIKKNYVAEE